jgi:hypothetical protein
MVRNLFAGFGAGIVFVGVILWFFPWLVQRGG